MLAGFGDEIPDRGLIIRLVLDTDKIFKS